LSHPLAFANQCLYHARIVQAGWQSELEAQREPSLAVDLAFAPLLQKVFLDAYGWLLLAGCRVRTAPEHPPHTVRDLPSLPAGLVLPAEIAACAELESTGWLAALQAPISRHATVRQSNNLASNSAVPTLEQFALWGQNLSALAQHIADAIDES
jgi:hypothetical protein